MDRKILIFVFSSFFFVSFAFAEEGRNTDSYTRPIKDTLQQEAKEIKENINVQKKETKSIIQNIRAKSKEDIEKRKEELKESAEQKREELKSRIEEAREKAKEELEARRAEFKEKLGSVRDEQKKKIAERIDEQLNELNERLMKHFSDVLDRLGKVLVNIESRTDKAEAKGWDVSNVRTMIQSAEKAINEARTAVEAQSGKTYTPQITGDEGKLKTDVGQTRQTLHGDLAAVKEKIRLAFEAVRRVATTLATVPRVDDEEENEISSSPTASPNPTP